MKKSEEVTAKMDEIIFEKRNKLYGAYFLRRMYNKHLYRALLISVSIMLAGLAYPLVSSYKTLDRAHRWINPETTVVIDNPIDPPVLPPIPPAPPISEKTKQIVFTVPQVVDDPSTETNTFLPMDDVNFATKNEQVDLNIEKYVEPKTIVIDVTEEKKEIFTIAEEMPNFIGGETERLKFLKDNIVYPSRDSEIGIQGTVYIQFVVDSKGNITDAKVVRGIGGDCDEEALRVVKAMPKWHPGKQNGKAVHVLFTMPISFKIQNS